jgi:hypothetical protein
MNENEQNTENWQIKINNFSFSLLSVSPVVFFSGDAKGKHGLRFKRKAIKINVRM